MDDVDTDLLNETNISSYAEVASECVVRSRECTVPTHTLLEA